jgi:hypothetical protein
MSLRPLGVSCGSGVAVQAVRGRFSFVFTLRLHYTRLSEQLQLTQYTNIRAKFVVFLHCYLCSIVLYYSWGETPQEG